MYYVHIFVHAISCIIKIKKNIYKNINLVVFQHLLLIIMYLTCASKVDIFNASMLSSKSFICFALAASYPLLYCCPSSNHIFSTQCCMFLLRISLRWIFFDISLLISSSIPYSRLCVRITVYSVQFFILGKVLVLSHAFYVIYEIHHYAQLASFKRSQLHCVYKKAGIL